MARQELKIDFKCLRKVVAQHLIVSPPRVAGAAGVVTLALLKTPSCVQLYSQITENKT